MTFNPSWKCPHCGELHDKSISYGPVEGVAGQYQTRHMYHGDVKCRCGETISGNEIIGGMHDHIIEPKWALVGCIIPLAVCFIATIAAGIKFGFVGVVVVMAAGLIYLVVLNRLGSK